MAWSWAKSENKKKDPWNVEQPAMKKRKFGQDVAVASRKILDNDKDDWDDSLELTQADLEEMDVIVSQAVQAEDVHHEDTSATEASFLVPLQLPPVQKRESSGSASDSSHRQGSTSSRQSNGSSRSLSSHSSEVSESVQFHKEKYEAEMKKAREDKYRIEGEVKFLRESLHKQEEELEKLRSERDDMMEEQKEAKSERERNLKQQLESLSSQSQFKERELKEQLQNLMEKNKKLQSQQRQQQGGSDVGLSQRQISPKKIPVKPSPPSKAKQQKLQQTASNNSQGFPTTFSFMQQNKTTVMPAAKVVTTTCTSCQTESVSIPSLSPSVSGIQTTKETRTKPPSKRRLKLRIPSSCSRYSEPVSGTQVLTQLLQASGGRLRSDNHDTDQHLDTGLSSLLHAMTIPLSLADLTYNRERGANFLSPVKPKRSNFVQRSVSQSSTEGYIQVVSKQHFRLAIEGLTLLMDENNDHREKVLDLIAKDVQPDYIQSINTDNTNQVASSANPQDRLINNNPSSNPSSSRSLFNSVQISPSQCSSPPNHLASVLLFPLLTDYIQHYLDLVQTGGTTPPLAASTSVTPSYTFKQPTCATPSKTPSKSFSLSAPASASLGCDSSLDSLSSCVMKLLHEGKVYASSVESYAVTALRTLHLLIRLCPPAKNVLINSLVDTRKKKPETVIDVQGATLTKKSATSSPDADDERSKSSSEPRVIVGPHSGLLRSLGFRSHESTCETWTDVCSTLVGLVMTIAGEDLQDSSASSAVVQQALQVLVELCSSCEGKQLDSLAQIVSKGILTVCLRQRQHLQVTLWAQKLLRSLSASERLLQQLCTKSENCPLYLMYRLCSSKRNNYANSDKMCVDIELIKSVYTISFVQHQNGCSILLSNDCPCSEELVVSVILAMDRLFTYYCQMDSSDKDSYKGKHVLSQLASGVTLIHTLGESDPLFAQHHARAQMQYVRMLSGLAPVFRADPKEWELHLPALEELCDFESDSGHTSQDSDEQMQQE